MISRLPGHYTFSIDSPHLLLTDIYCHKVEIHLSLDFFFRSIYIFLTPNHFLTILFPQKNYQDASSFYLFLFFFTFILFLLPFSCLSKYLGRTVIDTDKKGEVFPTLFLMTLFLSVPLLPTPIRTKAD